MQAQALNSPINTFYNKSKIILKIIYLSIMIKVPTEITIELKKRQFIWSTKPKINNETRSFDFKDKGLKIVDINKKKASLWCSLIKRLYDDSFHEWKLIPLKLFKKFGDELKFHSNL